MVGIILTTKGEKNMSDITNNDLLIVVPKSFQIRKFRII
jgi:hypothetical protein